MARIVIPENFLELEKLVKDINEKHVAEGAASPLARFDVAGTLADSTTARGFHDNGKKAEKQAEDFFEKRDNLMNPVTKTVRQFAQFLKQIYKDNPRELGNWGFVVDESQQDDGEKPATP
jgi:hypothetical protein